MMDDLRLAAVAARVVAWHNGHPLARRISAAHVHAVGFVGLPFVGATGVAASPVAASAAQGPAPDEDAEMVDLATLEAGSLRERALARARQQADRGADAAAPASAGPASAAASGAEAPLPVLATLQPDFSEDFIDPLRPRAVAHFAARAGQVLARPPTDGPVREVPADGAHPGRQPARVYLLTAVIETGTRKSRVLLGTGLTAPVLGHRIFDTLRVTGVAALAALVVGVPAWLLQPADAPPVPAPPASPPALAGASAETPAPAPAAREAAAQEPVAALPQGATRDEARAPVAGSPPAADRAASAAAPVAAVAPLPVAPRPGGAPSIRPVISDDDKARARQVREALNLPGRSAASAPGIVPVPVPVPIPASAPGAARAAAASPAPTPPAVPAQAQARAAPAVAAFALSTRPLRTRAEAEQVQVAMRSLLRTVGETGVQVDVLPQGDDWRVVALPFPQRAAADKARALLVSRGMRVEVIDF